MPIFTARTGGSLRPLPASLCHSSRRRTATMACARRRRSVARPINKPATTFCRGCSATEGWASPAAQQKRHGRGSPWRHFSWRWSGEWQGHVARGLGALYPYQDRVLAGLAGIIDGGADIARRRHRLAAGVEDNVALLQPLVGGDPARIDVDDHHALGTGAFHLFGRCQVQPELAVTRVAAALAAVLPRHLCLVVGEGGCGHGDGVLAAVAPDLQRQLLAGVNAGDLARQLSRIPDFGVAEGQHPLATPATGLGRGANVLYVIDQGALGVLEAEAIGDIRRHRLYHYANPAARHRTLAHELLGHGLGGRGRNVEGDADRAAGG